VSLRIPGLVLAAFALACSGGRTTPDAPGPSLGQVQVTLTLPREAPPVVTTSARLLRWRDLDGVSAVALAGETAPVLAPGQCAVTDAEGLLEDALSATTPDSNVQLLDAGEIMVTAAGRSMRLLPRYQPEIVPFVSGVVYDVEPLSADDLVPELVAGDVFVSAFGGEDVARFDTAASLPALPRLVSIDGRDPASEPLLEISRARDLELVWTSGGRLGDDLITVILAWGGGELRCRPAEPGRLRVPEARLAAVPDGTEVVIAVERSARQPFAAPGLEAGELEVSVRDAVPVKVW
jgi:hypothetical protein